MRLTIILLLISSVTYGQTYWWGNGKDTVSIVKLKHKIVKVSDGTQAYINLPLKDTATIFQSSDGKKYIGLVTWRIAYDTSSIIVESTNAAVVKENMTSVTGSAKPGISGQSFVFVTNTNVTGFVTYDFVITGEAGYIEVYSERYAGHGKIGVILDGKPAFIADQGIAPYGTDLQRGSATFRAPVTKGTHKIIVQSYQAPAQWTVDFFKVWNLK